MKDIANFLNYQSSKKDTTKFKIFIREYGHEVFLRILSKSMFISFAFVMLAGILASRMATKDVSIFSFVISILMTAAYFAGKVIDAKYIWIYQGTIYSVASYIMLRLYLLDIVDLDFKLE